MSRPAQIAHRLCRDVIYIQPVWEILNRQILRFVVVLLTIPSSVLAETTYDDYVRRLDDHPAVQAFRSEAAAAKYRADGELGLPDPALTLGVNNVPVSDPSFDRFLPTSKSVGVAQKIPFPGTLIARSEMEEEKADQSSLRATYARSRLEAEFVAALAERQRILTTMPLLDEQLELYEELENILRGYLAAGNPVFARLSGVDADRTEVALMRNNLDQQLVEADATLTRLMDEVPTIPPPHFDPMSWNGEAERVFPLVIAQQEIKIAGREVELREADFWPDLNVSAEYLQRESGETFEGDDWFTVRVGLSVPLWSSFNQEPKLRAAQSSATAARSRFKDVAREWKRQLTILANARETAFRNVGVYQDKVSSFEALASDARRTYETGFGSLEVVLNADIERLRAEAGRIAERARLIRLTADFNSHIIGDRQ